jgi:hypothetical protein
MKQAEEELMNSPTPDQATDQSFSAQQLADSELKGPVEQESIRPMQSTPAKVEVDAERIRSAIARLTSNSIDELEKLTSELEKLQDFLKSETTRVQGEINNVLAGVGVIVEAIAPWKSAGAASTANIRANGRDRLKRWP